MKFVKKVNTKIRKFFRLFNLDFDADWISNKAQENSSCHILVNEYVLIVLLTLLPVGFIIAFYHIQLLGIALFIFFIFLTLFLKLSVRTEPRVINVLNIILTYIPLIILSHEIDKDFSTHGDSGIYDVIIYLVAVFAITIVSHLTLIRYKHRCKSFNSLVNVRRATSKDILFIKMLYYRNSNRRAISTDLTNKEINNLKTAKNEQNELWIISSCCRGNIGWINLKPLKNSSVYSYTAIISIYIKNNFKNKKYGSSALNFVNQNAQNLGYHTILANISDSDVYSQRLFKSMNFIKYGYLPNIIENGSHIHGLYIFGKRYY